MKKKILISASLFHTLNDAASVTVPMIFPLLYSQQFIITKYSHIGILSNLGFLVTFFFQLIIANISDRFEYKHMLLFSYAGISVALALMTLPTAFSSFLFMYLTIRVFKSFYHSVGVTWVSRTHPSQRMDFAMGIQSGSGNLGVFIAFISSGFLAQSFSWKTPLLVWAVLCFILGSISFLFVRNVSTKSEEVFKPDFASWIETLNKIRVFIPGFIFGGACWGTTVYYAPSLLNHRFHIPLGQTGLYLALWIGVGTVMTYLFGFFSRNIGRAKISRYSFLGSTFFIFLLGLAPLKEIALVSLFLFGVSLFLMYPAFQSFIGNEVHIKNQAQAFSLIANVQMLTAAIVVFISGFLSDSFGINSPFILLGIVGIAISIFYFFQKLKVY
ncbi:MAG: MFS transporter [Candidatus Aminicenantes bacterium]|nr:MFS transporter [Candidatus Aminicenantes bacterium]